MVSWVTQEPLLHSVSAYYHEGGLVRDWFVGSLVAVGAFLILYKGFSERENLLLNVAGCSAIGVALFPTKDVGEDWGLVSIAHFAFAATFFVCIVFVCWKLSSDTLSLIEDPVRRLRLWKFYRIIAGAMVVLPIAAVGLLTLLGLARVRLFALEAIVIFVFGIYWLVKSRELRETNAESLALQGRITTVSTADPEDVTPGRLVRTDP